MSIKIEKNIPIPSLARKYPLDQMDVGDSIFVPTEHNRGVKSSVSRYARLNNKRFTTRSVDGGVRIWRVK